MQARHDAFDEREPRRAWRAFFCSMFREPALRPCSHQARARFAPLLCAAARLRASAGTRTFCVMKPHALRNGSSPIQDNDEAALIARLRAGEAAAYEALVRDYGGRMLAVARRILIDEDHARDAVQEAFLSAFKAIDKFVGGSRLGTWLHRIVTNAALMKLRARGRKPETQFDDLLPTFHEDGRRQNAVSAWDGAADVLAQRAETREIVRRSIDRLPDDYRTVLMLRDMDQLDTEETAELLGVNQGVVKTRLHRARQALRTLLEKELA